jgi:hypothetical protein
MTVAREGSAPTEPESDIPPGSAPRAYSPLVPSETVKVEKNLSSLGFFTPSSKRIKRVWRKSIVFHRMLNGNKVAARATIVPSAEYGLPTTADQDKFLALQKIITDMRHRHGEVRNPVGFSSAELLRILGKRVTAGKNYEDIAEWLRRMTLTGVRSEGTVFFAAHKVWATDTFHVFERSVSFGSAMPDGRTADKNYVWLSEWQLENINNNYLLQVDLEAYKQLRNHIAKTLVPLLHIWLSGAHPDGIFAISYEELCQILNMSRYRHFSKIQEKLAPSLNELKYCKYLSDWRIEPAGGTQGFRILFYHGDRFRKAPLPLIKAATV